MYGTEKIGAFPPSSVAEQARVVFYFTTSDLGER
jgi:hypothetical protein